MKNSIKFPFFILLILLFMTSACGGNESTDVKTDIIGNWISDNENLTLEFTPDQKVHSVLNNGNISITMNSDIIWVDENTILGVWEPNISTWEVRIWDTKMQMKSEGGRKLIFYRAD